MEEPERHRDQINASDARIRTPLSIASNSNAPANASVTPNLSPCVGEPRRLGNQMDLLDTCRCMQDVTDDSRRSESTCQTQPETPQTTGKLQTYQVQDQNYTQRSHRGPRTTRMHRAHACTYSALESAQKRLEKQWKMSA